MMLIRSMKAADVAPKNRASGFEAEMSQAKSSPMLL
jgi:hypothetical protein